jgi:2-polyprenyl-3-methyl-5-hydroxy-6-metoxy-1,4-benzoquinol methylase
MLSWRNFWASNPKSFGIVMQKSTEYFVEKCLLNNVIKKGSSILDYGCGPGYLANTIINFPSNYIGVDISETYINTCKTNFSNNPNFQFRILNDTEKNTVSDSYQLPNAFFDTVIILSVVQYLGSKEKVAKLIASIVPSLKPTGEIILADVIDSEKHFLKDLFFIGLYSLSKGYFFQFLEFAVRLRFSSYNKLRLTNKLLMLQQKEIADICQRLHLQYTVLEACTLQRSRKTYLIRF